MTKRNLYLISIVFALFSAGCFIYEFIANKATIETIWGEKFACDESILKVMESPIMQRLKKIDQSGQARYFGRKLPPFSRYDHSIGVFAILKKAGASFKEQITGLLHDSSYTAFSHVCDYLFAKDIQDYVNNGYQDSIHIQYLKKNKIDVLLSEVGLTVDDIDIKNETHPRLEQDLPDMCADRIQYNVHTAVILGILSEEEAALIIDDLRFRDNKWFFQDKRLAKKFAELSLYFSQNFWGSIWNVSMSIHLTNAIKRAMELKIVNIDDIFSYDEVVLSKLLKSADSIITANIKQCHNPLMNVPGMPYKNVFFNPKFRGIDPLVEDEKSGSLVRLSEIDPMFHSYFIAVKKWCADGFNVAVLDL